MLRFQVEEALSELVADNDGCLRANCLDRLYHDHPEARDIVADAGGLRRFCDKSDELLFVPDAGCGEIRLRSDLVEAYAVDNSRERELERELAEAKADAEAEAAAKA
eukprot:COSAG04_NODE_20718_length_388_cov_0.536332_1_plen_106_part_10